MGYKTSIHDVRVSRRLLMAKAPVRYNASVSGIYGGQSAIRTDLSPRISVFLSL
jgi:hypothetical protein